MAQHGITAIAWRDGKLEWTSLAPHGSGWKTSGHGVEPPPDPPTAEFVKPLAAKWPGALWLTLPAAQALLRVVSLPTTDDTELRGMAELQLDKFSPFPAENMVMALEVVERQEKATRVLIAAAQREAIAAQAAALLAAGLLPAGVGVDILGWWQNLKAAGKLAERGGELVILLTSTGADLLALHNGHPLLFRALSQNLTGSAEIIEELDFALLSLEAEWGEETPRLSVWRAPEVPAALAEAIQAHTELRVTVHELAQLPTLTEGVAQRAADAAAMAPVINLVLPDWLTEARQRVVRRRLTLAGSVVGVAWFLAVAGVIGASQLAKSNVANMQREQARLEAPVAEVRRQQDLVKVLQQYSDPAGTALECLREISAALPDGVKITSFTFAKGEKVQVRGEAEDAKGIYAFQQGLKGAPRFKQVQLHGITPPSGKQQHTGFSVTVSLSEEQP
ncbi:MAG: PilN domain-containing protein [Kiritimatiellaeota bacterium]|nr:PilN domain-containing protein [Kiritimatiellota bacterium]